MFGIVHFEHGWMVSRQARRRFMLLSAFSLILGFDMLGMSYRPKLFNGNLQPAPVRAAVTLIVLPAIAGGLCMFLGMAWYCLEIDSSKKFVRLLRAFMLLVTFPFGQVAYYFLIYRPQTERVEMRII